MGSPAISIKNLVKKYNSQEAINDISLDVKEGELFGFLGPNGAGKTSTINAITGVANFNSGKIEVFGHDVVSDYKNARSFIGLAPQEYNFDPFFSVFETFIYQGGYYGVPRELCKSRAIKLMEQFNLSGKKNSKIRTLSGGTKRRLIIARAMIHEPKILILDEPTAGVDVELRHDLWNMMKGLKEQGKTIFLTTHYIEEAEKLCDRICILNKGKIIEIDDKDKLMNKFARSEIEILVKNPLKSVPNTLKSFNLKIVGNNLIFTESKEKIDSIIKAVSSNLEIVDITIQRSSLEDIFIDRVKNHG
jgi:ABC-2 type transport system ATP-binding protein